MAPVLDPLLVPEMVVLMVEGSVPQLWGQELEPLWLERERVSLLVPVLWELGMAQELVPVLLALELAQVLVPLLLEMVWVLVMALLL